MPVLRRIMTRVHLRLMQPRSGRERHPLDRRYGTRTSGILPLFLLRPGTPVDDQMIIYVGCVPSALRIMLATIDDIATCNFLDLGCGLGRALIVASEYDLRSIVGIELNPDLVLAARANARRIATIMPRRTRIEIREGDASRPVLPGSRTIIFLYHPFGAALVVALKDSIMVQAGPGDRVHVIYANPVHGAIFDREPRFARWAAATLPCDGDERGHGFDAHENIVMWCLGGDDTPSLHPRDLRIVTTIPDHKVELALPQGPDSYPPDDDGSEADGGGVGCSALS